MQKIYLYLLAGGLILQLQGMEPEGIPSTVPTLEKLCLQAIAENPQLAQQAATSNNTTVQEMVAAKVLLDSTTRVTTNNIDQFRTAAARIGQDMTREHLQQAANILALQKQATTSNAEELKDYVLNFTPEQHGKLRFKLLVWFMHNQHSQLPTVDKLHLGWEYLFAEDNQTRKDALIKDLASLITTPKDIMDIDVARFVARRTTPEYNALHRELASSCASSACVCSTSAIESLILKKQKTHAILAYVLAGLGIEGGRSPEERERLKQFADVTIPTKLASIPPYTQPNLQGTNP